MQLLMPGPRLIAVQRRHDSRESGLEEGIQAATGTRCRATAAMRRRTWPDACRPTLLCHSRSRQMPIQWTISKPAKLVVAVCKGSVTRQDIEGYLDAVVVADVMAYRKIFDAT